MGDTGHESLVLTSGDEVTFVLHSKYRFSPGADDGLLFLAYTRSAEMGGGRFPLPGWIRCGS